MNKHIFSEMHKDHLHSLILSRKTWLDMYVKQSDTNPVTYLPYVYPNPKKLNEHLNLCFGCKSAYFAPHSKTHECPKFKEGIEVLKKLLSTEKVMQELPSQEPVVDTKELESLKKQVAALQKKAELDKQIVDKAFDMEDALFSLLSNMQENDFKTFKNSMLFLKGNSESVFSKMCKDLDISEYISDTEGDSG